MEEQVKAPQIIVPVNAPPMEPEQAAKGERTVLMIFDTPVHLTVEANKSIFYPKGVHPVPARYADHWYLKAHGARRAPLSVNVGENTRQPRQQPQQGQRNGRQRN